MVFIILLLLLLLVYFSLFDSLSLNVFQCDSVVPMFVLSYFILFNPFVGAGLVAGLWILLAARVVPSYRVGLLANCRAVLGT